MVKTMEAFLRRGWRLARDESGAVAIEYALLAAIITVAIIAALSALGTQLGSIFNSVGNNLAPP
jgi:pilus assembly protein Flp/PilA